MADKAGNLGNCAKLDKDAFIKAIRSAAGMVKSAKGSAVSVSKESIEKCFEGMELAEGQKELIFQYLENPQLVDMKENIKMHRHPVGLEVNLKEDKKKSKDGLMDTVFFKMYQEDLEKIKACTPDEEEELYSRLLSGDRLALHKLSDQWQVRVLELAKSIRIPEKELADAIQEGNLGVFFALKELLGLGKNVCVKEELEKAALQAIEAYLYSTAAAKDMDDSLIAKAVLVHEAKEYLAEELLRLPTMEELSQYTKLPIEELEDILAYSENRMHG